MSGRAKLVAVFVAAVIAAIGTTVVVATAIRPVPSAPWRLDPGPTRVSLDEGWTMRSQDRVGGDASAISRPGFRDDGWHPVTLPSTVLAGLAAGGAYPHLLERGTLRHVDEARFEVPWWFRRDLRLADEPGARTWLRFDGINDRADLYVNGSLVADATRISGAFRTYAFDITRLVHPGMNAVAIRVYPVDPDHDLTITWVDWNPIAPDHGMGIWHDVWLERTGPVTVEHPQVVADLPLPESTTADLTVSATVRNASAGTVTARVVGRIAGTSFTRTFSTDLELPPRSSEVVTFDPASVPSLRIPDPPLWWPYRMGEQPMQSLVVTASVGGVTSDSDTTAFGIREVSSELLRNGARRFLVNGQPILVRGGGWASDILLRPAPDRVDAQLGYVRDLGLNTVRLEGKFESDHFFDVADRLGILVMPGWMCCDRWQQTWKWTPDEVAVARASITSQALRLRNHPSVFTFLIGSDTKPVLDVQRMYVDALVRARWPNPILASATDDTSSVLGRTGVKMTGPYDWIPPAYWSDPRAAGGATGFNSETSWGASIPELDHVRRMLDPRERRALWQEPRTPQYHAGVRGSVFQTLRIFDRAISARMGVPTSLADFVRKAQVMQYEGARAMFEAFSRDRWEATGVIQWMLNNAWPSLHWNLFDWYLELNGSSFGTKLANEPVHIQYGYDDASVYVVNDTQDPVDGYLARASVFDLSGAERWTKTARVSVASGQVVRLFPVGAAASEMPVWFLELRIVDPDGRQVSRNVYWLSSVRETLAWRDATWFYTPTRTYADFTALSELPSVRPTVVACDRSTGTRGVVDVTVVNDTDRVAFFLRPRLTHAKGPDVAPISWSDGDVTLFPGERQTLTATFATDQLGGSALGVSLEGWNVPALRPLLRRCG